MRGPHGIGKSTLSALATLWFGMTRDGAEDWKLATTASAWRQLTKFLWPEIHKWARKINWMKIGRPQFRPEELLMLSLKMNTGEAFAVASNDPTLIEGAHADQLMYVFDESKAIPAGTWDAAEGAFSGGGASLAQEAYALSISTPGDPEGRFYDIQSRKAGYEDWDVMHVTLDEAIRAGRISAAWAEQRAKQWGVESAVYRNRVLGEFAEAKEGGLISLRAIEAANARWLALNDQVQDLVSVGLELEAAWEQVCGRLICVSADVARFGSNKTVIGKRRDMTIQNIDKYERASTMETAGRLNGVLSANPSAYAIVDVVGVGGGVVDKLREDKRLVSSFNGGEHTDRKDRSGELGFVDTRSAAYWNLREILDPEFGREEVALPPDDELTGDLTAPTYRVMSGGKIKVESKGAIEDEGEGIAERLGRSTDCGDMVAQAFWVPELPRSQQVAQAYKERYEAAKKKAKENGANG